MRALHWTRVFHVLPVSCHHYLLCSCWMVWSWLWFVMVIAWVSYCNKCHFLVDFGNEKWVLGWDMATREWNRPNVQACCTNACKCGPSLPPSLPDLACQKPSQQLPCCASSTMCISYIEFLLPVDCCKMEHTTMFYMCLSVVSLKEKFELVL
jgi:hypothetical protein